MSYGIEVTRANGKVIASQTMPGGRVYVGKITAAAGTSPSPYIYPEVPGGSSLRVLQVSRGAHTWSTGTNAQGQATITLTPVSNRFDYSTVLYIFTTQTTEPSYGIQTINDVGERSFSTIFPCPEFLGKVTFSSTPSYSEDLAEGSYWSFVHNTTSNLGAGRTRLILWNLPENAGDCWFTGTTLIESYVTGNYVVTAKYIKPTAVSSVVPEAFVFALDGLTESSDTHGLRVYDGSTPQKLLFDAGLNHMIIKGYETVVDYPNTTGTTFTYANLTNISNSPVFLIPSYSKEVWTRIATTQSSNGVLYTGCMRRVGNTLYTKLVKETSLYEDAIVTGTWYYGVSQDLTQLVVNGTDYGATTAGLLLTVTKSANTTQCSFNSNGIGNTTTCTSVTSCTATVTGGNNGPIAYAWSFITNPGSLTLANANSSTCTILKTASAPISGSSTFSGTLRCTVTQTGSSTVYVDTPIVHTHQDTYSSYVYENPGGA